MMINTLLVIQAYTWSLQEEGGNVFSAGVRTLGQRLKTSPTGIEPAHSDPESDALSTELRGLCDNHTIKVNAPQPQSIQSCW